METKSLMILIVTMMLTVIWGRVNNHILLIQMDNLIMGSVKTLKGLLYLILDLEKVKIISNKYLLKVISAVFVE